MGEDVDEETLEGGNLETAVRVGDTLRRAAGAWKADDGDAAFRNLIAGGYVDRMRRDAEWLDRHHSSGQNELR